MIELIVQNKKKRLYQWDTGRKVKIECLGVTVDEVRFSNVGMKNALVVAPYEENGITVADIPNILLQESKRISAFAVSNTESGQETICGESFSVTEQTKPSDYVYTETEILSYKAIAEKSATQLEINNAQIEKLIEVVASADKYIGEYEYKELLYEFTEDDFLEKIVLLENQISTYKDSNNIYQVTMPTHDWTGEDTYLITINGEEYIKVTTSNYEYSSNGSTFVIDGHDINITADYFETAPTVSVIFVKDNKYVYKEIEDTDTFFNNDIQIEFELRHIFEDGSESTITALATRNEKVTTESYRRILFYENSCMSILSEWWYYPVVDVGDGFNTLSNAIESSIKNIWIGEWDSDEWDYNPIKSVRIYKLHKSLGSRIAELIDEINGEVV